MHAVNYISVRCDMPIAFGLVRELGGAPLLRCGDGMTAPMRGPVACGGGINLQELGR